jgi:hypothetical protein
MTDFTRSFDIMIDAPVHEVFEYCRDPHHLFEGWPALEVTDVVMTPEGVGTKAHIVGRFAKGMILEQIERQYTEFVPDARTRIGIPPLASPGCKGARLRLSHSRSQPADPSPCDVSLARTLLRGYVHKRTAARIS